MKTQCANWCSPVRHNPRIGLVDDEALVRGLRSVREDDKLVAMLVRHVLGLSHRLVVPGFGRKCTGQDANYGVAIAAPTVLVSGAISSDAPGAWAGVEDESPPLPRRKTLLPGLDQILLHEGQ